MEEVLNNLGWKNIIIIRDPRDQCASVLHKLKIKKNNPRVTIYMKNLLQTEIE